MSSETGPPSSEAAERGRFVPPEAGDPDTFPANYEFVELLGRGAMVEYTRRDSRLFNKTKMNRPPTE